MPRSHTCNSCGLELAKVRALIDPHYGLAVVVCPTCQVAVVRSRNTDLVFWWRTVRRCVFVLAMLLLQLAVCAAFTGLVAGLIVNNDDEFRSWRLVYDSIMAIATQNQLKLGSSTRLDVLDIHFFFGVLMLCGLMVGIWLKTFVAHIPWPRTFLFWVLWLAFWIMSDALFITLGETVSIVLDIEFPEKPIPAKDLGIRFALLSIHLMGVLIGWYPGFLLHRARDKRRAQRFKRILRRVRKRRQVFRESR